MNKKCEVCGQELPENYGNLLCDTHYLELIKKQEERKAEVVETLKKTPDSPINSDLVATKAPIGPEMPPGEEKTAEVPPSSPSVGNGSNFGILDPNYKENPEAEDKDQILANLAQFIYSHDPAKKRKGKLLWYPQRNMYTFIKNYCIKRVTEHPQYPKYVWKPTIVDVGCGSGVGSNVMSQEADFVWGIDKNAWSIEFAQEAFTREKNGIYYNSQLTFDQFDPMVDTRETMQFDLVVAIEIIEHIYNTDKFLRSLIKFAKKDKRNNYVKDFGTEFFISTPNRAFKKLRKDQPANIFHVREYKADEFHKYLSGYFEKIEFMNQKGEPVDNNTEVDEVILAKCSLPRV